MANKSPFSPAKKITTPLGPKSNSLASAQEKAMKQLMAEREAYAKKHGGNYPSDAELMKSRKK